MRFSKVYRSEAELRTVFRPPAGGAVAKQIDRLDDGCKSFLAHSPISLIGTTNADGTGDVSPKGGPPGFWTVLDDHHLAMGELPGNNRIDTYRNLVTDPRIGLLFLVPGIGETLRVNGLGYVVGDDDVLDACAIDAKRPKVALAVEVVEAFIHCAKALRRSNLWETTGWPDVTDMPTVACMFNAHVGVADDPDGARTSKYLEDGYATTMWNA